MKMKFARKRVLRKSFKLLGSLDKTQRNAKYDIANGLNGD